MRLPLPLLSAKNEDVFHQEKSFLAPFSGISSERTSSGRLPDRSLRRDRLVLRAEDGGVDSRVFKHQSVAGATSMAEAHIAAQSGGRKNLHLRIIGDLQELGGLLLGCGRDILGLFLGCV